MNDNGKPIPINHANAISQSRSGDSATIRNRRNEAMRLDRLGNLKSGAASFTPRSLEPDKLKGLNHADWLEDYSQLLALNTGLAMTPMREGRITRLHWAADYVKLLEQTNRDLAVEIEKLRRSSATPEA